MKVNLIDIYNENDLGKAEAIYLEAFPPEEQRKWEDITGEGEPRLRGIYYANKLVGIITTWTFDEAIYVEHLAIDPSMRSMGLGNEVLTQLKNDSDRPLLLEIEPPESSEQAQRRLGFYQRNGFTTISTSYIQPPYGPGLPWVPLHLMSTSVTLDSERVGELLHRHVYGYTSTPESDNTAQ